MKMIKEKWDSEIWGATTSPGTNKHDTINRNLVLFWGKNVGSCIIHLGCVLTML